jgi:hypothetical protein
MPFRTEFAAVNVPIVDIEKLAVPGSIFRARANGLRWSNSDLDGPVQYIASTPIADIVWLHVRVRYAKNASYSLEQKPPEGGF